MHAGVGAGVHAGAGVGIVAGAGRAAGRGVDIAAGAGTGTGVCTGVEGDRYRKRRRCNHSPQPSQAESALCSHPWCFSPPYLPGTYRRPQRASKHLHPQVQPHGDTPEALNECS